MVTHGTFLHVYFDCRCTCIGMLAREHFHENHEGYLCSEWWRKYIQQDCMHLWNVRKLDVTCM